MVALADHLAHHGVQLNVVHLARVQHLLGGGAIQDVRDGLRVTGHLPDLAEHLLSTRAVVALVQVEDDALALEALLLQPREEGVNHLLRGDREDL